MRQQDGGGGVGGGSGGGGAGCSSIKDSDLLTASASSSSSQQQRMLEQHEQQNHLQSTHHLHQNPHQNQRIQSNALGELTPPGSAGAMTHSSAVSNDDASSNLVFSDLYWTKTMLPYLKLTNMSWKSLNLKADKKTMVLVLQYLL